jgi:hypothetical protein
MDAAPIAPEARPAGRPAVAAARPTNHTARLYAIVVTLAVFLVLWATIALHPWQASQPGELPGSSVSVSAQPGSSGGSASSSALQPVTATRTS